MKMTKKQRKKLRKVQAYMEGRTIQEHESNAVPRSWYDWNKEYHVDEDYSYRGGVTKKGKTKFLRT